MKITESLSKDHRRFSSIIEELTSIANQGNQPGSIQRAKSLMGRLNDELQLHAWIEDIFFYPMARGAVLTAKSLKVNMKYMDALEIEHKTVENLLNRMNEEILQDTHDDSWQQTLALLATTLSDHTKKEEGIVFPFLEELIGEERLVELYNETEKQKKEGARVPLSS